MAGFSGITWTNGVTAVNQTNMQRYETFIEQLEGDSGSVSVSGTTAGTATLYQVLQGTFKMVWVRFNGYRNSTATEQTLALPVAFSAYGQFWTGATPATHIYLSSSQVNNKCYVRTSLPSGSGAGGISTQSAMNGYSDGEIDSAFDEIGLGVSMSQVQTGGLFIIGF